LPDGFHTHAFKGVTVFVDDHLHLFWGVSGPGPNVPGHTHKIAGTTTVNDGHSHPFRMMSQGPTYVDRERFKHYHYFEGETAVVQNHRHPMSGPTFVLGE
jgi:hypothetical protein